MKEQRKQELKRNFRPLFPGNGKISLETVKKQLREKRGIPRAIPPPPQKKKLLKTKM